MVQDAPGHNNQMAERTEGGEDNMLILFEIKTMSRRRWKVWLELHISLFTEKKMKNLGKSTSTKDKKEHFIFMATFYCYG